MSTLEDILEGLPGLLADLTALPVTNGKSNASADRVLRVGPHRVAVVAKSSSRAEAVAQAVENVRAAAKQAGPRTIPLVAVPFMGETGARICRDGKVGFVDLSGNADIDAPGLRIRVTGKPNRFVQRGRPSSVFAPKSSRLARLMLQDPKRSWRQSELAEKCKLGAGYVSRICKPSPSFGATSGRPRPSARFEWRNSSEVRTTRCRPTWQASSAYSSGAYPDVGFAGDCQSGPAGWSATNS